MKIKTLFVSLLLTTALIVGLNTKSEATNITDIVSGNIPVFDRNYSGIYQWLGYMNEDQEVEPSTIHGQDSDLETIFWNKAVSTFFLVTGFGADNGYDGQNFWDIFLSSTPGSVPYVFDLNRGSGDNLDIVDGVGHYEVFYGTDANLLDTVDGGISANRLYSNPYRYLDAGDDIYYKFGYYLYYSSVADGEDVTGGLHNVLASVIGGFSLIELIDFHTTLSSGNNTFSDKILRLPESALLFIVGLATVSAGRLVKK